MPSKGFKVKDTSNYRKPKSEEHRLKVIISNTGKKRSQEIKEKFSRMRKGVPKSEAFRKHLSEIQKGEKSHFWKGGKTKQGIIIRSSIEYKLWREAVFKRDNFNCVWCGSKKQIESDHIKPFADYPELRFCIDNGRTLCHECHKKTDTYKSKTRWKKYA